MLGAIIMFIFGFWAKRFKWWHVLLLLFLAAFAVQQLGIRISGQGFETGWAWISRTMIQQTLIEAVMYMAGIWLGSAWATRRAMKRHLGQEDEHLPPEA